MSCNIMLCTSLNLMQVITVIKSPLFSLCRELIRNFLGLSCGLFFVLVSRPLVPSSSDIFISLSNMANSLFVVRVLHKKIIICKWICLLTISNGTCLWWWSLPCSLQIPTISFSNLVHAPTMSRSPFLFPTSLPSRCVLMASVCIESTLKW